MSGIEFGQSGISPNRVSSIIADNTSIYGDVTFAEGAGINLSVSGNTITITGNSGEVDHNDLTNLQGGTTNEYYHLTASEHTELTNWLDSITLGDTGKITFTDFSATSGANTFLGQAKDDTYSLAVADGEEISLINLEFHNTQTTGSCQFYGIRIQTDTDMVDSGAGINIGNFGHSDNIRLTYVFGTISRSHYYQSQCTKFEYTRLCTLFLTPRKNPKI